MAQPQLSTALADLEFVAFDTETTGLSAAQERIIELSGVRFSLAGEVGTFESLVDPLRPIPEASTRVHGLKDSDVAGQPTVDAVLPRFAEFCEGAVLVAHNAEFDVQFLCHEAARHGAPTPGEPVLDTVEISRSLRSDLPNHKLETVSHALGCPAASYHRALADSQTLMHCFVRLLSEGLPKGTLADLVGLTSGALRCGPDERLRMWLPPQLAPLDEALDAGGRVTILYEPEGKRQEAREIEPRGYMRRPGATFLMASCDRSDRTFRLDWITRAQHVQATLF